MSEPGMSMPGMAGRSGMSSGMSGKSGIGQPPASSLSGGTSDNLLGGDASDAAYPLYLTTAELSGRVGTVHSFSATGEVMLPQGPPDVKLTADLGGDMMSYRWTVNGHTYDRMEPLAIQGGQRARLTFTNMSIAWHPMHLQGHTFQGVRTDGTPGPRKDTVIVLPMQKIEVDLVADNPGYWMLHCHNGYHHYAGMMTRLDYRS